MGGETTPIITLINCLVNRKGFINSSKPVKFFVNYKVPTATSGCPVSEQLSLPGAGCRQGRLREERKDNGLEITSQPKHKRWGGAQEQPMI